MRAKNGCQEVKTVIPNHKYIFEEKCILLKQSATQYWDKIETTTNVVHIFVG
jgi:hypothetical protein